MFDLQLLIKKENNAFGIKAISEFTRLSSCKNVSFYSLDELHLYSNIAKLFFSFLSSNFNARYKNENNPHLFPFELTPNDLKMVKQSVDKSLRDIPTHFNGNWKGVDFGKPSSLYRSVDYIEQFLFCTSSIISPRFKLERTGKMVNKLVRGCLIVSQWEVDKDQVDEAER
jgi:hypothetical protein